jgi:hypothetical protein
VISRIVARSACPTVETEDTAGQAGRGTRQGFDEKKEPLMIKESKDVQLPAVIEEYLANLSKRVRNRRVRADVVRELRSHFLEALMEVEEKNREKSARELIREFGEPELLAELIKRAKKRGRPAWLKFTIRSIQVFIGIIVFFIVYSLWAFWDKPSPTVDYVAELNALAHPGKDLTENGAPFYEKADKRFIDYPKNIKYDLIVNVGMPLSSKEKEAIQDWVLQNEPALEMVRQASQRSQARFAYNTYKSDNVANICFFNVNNMREFTRLFYARIWLVDGDDQAKILADLRPTYTMARHLEAGPFLIEQMVGNAITAMSACETRRLLRMGKFKSESLPRLAEILDETYPHGYPKLNLSGELMGSLDIIQKTFTNGGIGGGHLCPKAFHEMTKSILGLRQDLWEELTKKPQLAFFIAHPRRNATLEKIKEYYALLDQWNMTPYEQSLKQNNPCKEFMAKNQNNLIFSVFLLPGLGREIGRNYSSKAEFEATRTVVALLQYKHDRGRNPESLTELVPAYLKELPRDPYGPDTLIYRRTGEDFLLYSRGRNFEDDGGKHLPTYGYAYDQEGKKIIDKNGDYVFWPMALPERKQ